MMGKEHGAEYLSGAKHEEIMKIKTVCLCVWYSTNEANTNRPFGTPKLLQVPWPATNSQNLVTQSVSMGLLLPSLVITTTLLHAET